MVIAELSVKKVRLQSARQKRMGVGARVNYYTIVYTARWRVGAAYVFIEMSPSAALGMRDPSPVFWC